MPELEQPGLQHVKANAEELFIWYVALQEAGFNDLQAYGLLQPLVLTGSIRREAD